jgi:hypothetical protein
MIIGNGRDPFLLVKATLDAVKQNIREDMSLPPAYQDDSMKLPKVPAGPQMANYLGWCTWDSFYTVRHQLQIKIFRTVLI